MKPNQQKPWETRPDWRNGQIQSSGGRNVRFMWTFAFVWNAFLVLVACFVGAEIWRRVLAGERKLLFLSVFVLAGLFLLGRAVLITLRQRKFGVAVLELDAVPAVLGGWLKGHVTSRLSTRPQKPVALTLTCSHVWITRSYSPRGGRSVDMHVIVLWSHEVELSPESLEPGPRGLTVPVKMYVPYGLKATDVSNPDDRVVWTLTVDAQLPGVDFIADFEIPFFVTADSRVETTEERLEHVSRARRPPSYTPRGFRTPVEILEAPSGSTVFFFRPDVPLHQTIVATLLSLAVLALAPITFILGWHYLVALLALLFGGLFALGSVLLWGLVGRLTVEAGHLELLKTVFGRSLGSARRVSYDAIAHIGVCRALKQGASRKDKDWSIEILLKNGEAIDPVAMVSSRPYAVWLAAEIERRLLPSG